MPLLIDRGQHVHFQDLVIRGGGYDAVDIRHGELHYQVAISKDDILAQSFAIVDNPLRFPVAPPFIRIARQGALREEVRRLMLSRITSLRGVK